MVSMEASVFWSNVHGPGSPGWGSGTEITSGALRILRAISAWAEASRIAGEVSVNDQRDDAVRERGQLGLKLHQGGGQIYGLADLTRIYHHVDPVHGQRGLDHGFFDL